MADRKPTPKQKKAIELLSENVGMSIRQAMLGAGYSPESADNPGILTNSEAYNRVFPEDVVARAKARLSEQIDSDNEKIAQDASKYVVDKDVASGAGKTNNLSGLVVVLDARDQT